MGSFIAFIKYYIIISALFLTSFFIVNHGQFSNFDPSSLLTSDSNMSLKTSSNYEIDTSETSSHYEIDTVISDLEKQHFTFSDSTESNALVNNADIPDFWTTLHSIESKQGRLLYRPSNKAKSCSVTSSPCGHHQLSLQALKDISCTSRKCKSDREDYKKSLAMSKRFEALNLKRLKKIGITNLPEYQQYLIHQQGANGLKVILAASQGKKQLSKKLKKNMANNSPYSYRRLSQLGSKLAAKKFLKHWKQKWQDEKQLIIAYQRTSNPVSRLAHSGTQNKKTTQKNKLASRQALFNDYQIQIALNIKVF